MIGVVDKSILIPIVLYRNQQNFQRAHWTDNLETDGFVDFWYRTKVLARHAMYCWIKDLMIIILSLVVLPPLHDRSCLEEAHSTILYSTRSIRSYRTSLARAV